MRGSPMPVTRGSTTAPTADITPIAMTWLRRREASALTKSQTGFTRDMTEASRAKVSPDRLPDTIALAADAIRLHVEHGRWARHGLQYSAGSSSGALMHDERRACRQPRPGRLCAKAHARCDADHNARSSGRLFPELPRACWSRQTSPKFGTILAGSLVNSLVHTFSLEPVGTCLTASLSARPCWSSRRSPCRH